jgi:hypothetical protein
MSEIKRRAQEARDLAAFEPFRAIADEIKSEAVAVFCNAASDAATIERAHSRIRAVETFLSAIQIRLNADMVAEKKKAQDRGSD